MEELCTVTTIRAPFKQTLQFAHYHLSAGASEVILFFDDASDPAADALEDRNQVTVIRCGNEYWESSEIAEPDSIEKKQVHNASLGLDLARQRGHDWVAHIDGDELLFTEEDLQETLASVDSSIQVCHFQTLEAVPSQYDCASPFEEISTFRQDGRRRYKLMAKLLGCQGAFYEGQYLRGHTAGKCATRTSASVRKLGIHGPRSEGGDELSILSLENGYTLHYDCCNLDSFRTKWRRRFDGVAPAENMRSSRSQQGEELRRRLGNEKEVRKLYERLYFLPGYERFVLHALGLLKEVEISVPETGTDSIPAEP